MNRREFMTGGAAVAALLPKRHKWRMQLQSSPITVYATGDPYVDATNIQNALDIGRDVYLPDPLYQLPSKLFTWDCLRVSGLNARLYGAGMQQTAIQQVYLPTQSGEDTYTLAVRDGRLHISDLTIQSIDGWSQWTPEQTHVLGLFGNSELIAERVATRYGQDACKLAAGDGWHSSVFDKCQFRDGRRSGLAYHSGCLSSRVIDCEFSGISDQAIDTEPPGDGLLKNITLSNCDLRTVAGAFCLTITRTENFQVNNCRVYGMALVYFALDTTISNSLIDAVNGGLVLSVRGASVNTQLSGNTYRYRDGLIEEGPLRFIAHNSYAPHGIQVRGGKLELLAYAPYGVQCYTTENVSIDGLEIDANYTGTAVDHAIVNQAAEEDHNRRLQRVANNHIHGNISNGITMTARYDTSMVGAYDVRGNYLDVAGAGVTILPPTYGTNPYIQTKQLEQNLFGTAVQTQYQLWP